MGTTNNTAALIGMFQLQTRLFHNVTTGFSAEQAQTRISGITNHAAWLAGHIVSTRYSLTALLGGTEKEPFPELFERGKGMIEGQAYPEISELVKGWDAISAVLMDKITGLTEEQLFGDSPIQVPMATGDLISTIAFFASHEAYTIGQLGILRRSFGLDAMKYS